MNLAPGHHMQAKPSRSKHNSNHRKQRRKVAKLPKDAVSDPVRLVQRSSSASDSASYGGTSKQYPDRTGRPAAAAAAVAVGGMEGVAKKKTARGRPNRPWKPWAKLSLTDIENIAERRGNSGRGFEQ